MQSNAAVNVNNAPVAAPSVFVEYHGHGEHTISFPFKAGGDDDFFARDAAEKTQLVGKLRNMVEAIGGMTLNVRHNAVQLTAQKKGDFPLIAAIMQTSVGTMTPAEFAAEVEAALPGVVALYHARNKALALRDSMVADARTVADAALADEIADLKARVDALAAKHARLCNEAVQAKMTDDATFAGFDNPTLVREETAASFARRPANFEGRFLFRA